MHRKLVLFMVLLCLSPLPLSGALPKLKSVFSRFKPVISIVKGALDVIEVCQFIKPTFDCTSIVSPSPPPSPTPSPPPSPPPSGTGSSSPMMDESPMVDVSANTYILNLFVGSNQQSVTLIADITTDLIFMLCQPCNGSCSTNSTVFEPGSSDTFYPNQCLDGYCSYNYTTSYATSEGNLSRDMFYFSDRTPMNPIIFGCGDLNTGNYGNAIGYLGLGLGNFSLAQQLTVSKFSYCLSSDPSVISPFILSSDIQLSSSLESSTKFLSNPTYPNLYYINMTGITVGETYVDIPSTRATVIQT